MNLLRSLICLVCSVLVSLGLPDIHSSELDYVTVMSSSGEEFQSAVGELESDGASGLFTDSPLLSDSPGVRPEEARTRGVRKRNGGKKRNKSQVTVGQKSFTSGHTFSTSSHTPGQVHHTFSTTMDPCFSSHRDYCIHGYCTYLQDLKEPVCVCMKGYDGVRCGIQLLQTSSGSDLEGPDDHTHTLQLTLVIIAVILSIISCSAIIIIITVQYKAQHSFQAAFLSSNSEKEKLQKNLSV